MFQPIITLNRFVTNNSVHTRHCRSFLAASLLTMAIVPFALADIGAPLPPAWDAIETVSLKDRHVVLPTMPIRQNSPAPQEAPSQAAESVPSTPASTGGSMTVSIKEPLTGKKVNVDINSESLHYDTKTGRYEAQGEVYLTIPEDNTEIIADRVSFDADEETMVAYGRVYIIQNGNVIGANRAVFDLNNQYSWYDTPKTIMSYFRLTGEQGEKKDKLTVVKKGKMIIDETQMQKLLTHSKRSRFGFGNGYGYAFYSADWARRFQINSGLPLINGLNLLQTGTDMPEDVAFEDGTHVTSVRQVVSPQDINEADFSDNQSDLRLKVNKLNIFKGKKGYDIVEMKGLTYKYRKIPLMYFPFMDFGYSEDDGYLSYLGPEYGYDLDLGGYYAGPGFQKQFAKGWLKLVPFVTYGAGRRDGASSNNPDLVPTQPGVGAEMAYLSQRLRARGGYNTTLGAPRFLGEYRVLPNSGATRIRGSYNHVVSNGFYGSERPHWSLEARDFRMKRLWDNRLVAQSYVSAGVLQDEFFPNGVSKFFARAHSLEPLTTYRAQFQGSLQTGRPLIQIKDFLALGALARMRAGFYGTGDHLVVMQAGPTLSMTLGRFFTQATYLMGMTSGRSPFVFDSYYSGTSNLQMANSFEVSKRLTVGVVHNFNMTRSNARRDLVVGQQVFFSFGPDSMKFSFVFDVIQKRSYFGITFNPAGGSLTTNFNQLNYFDPGYDQANQSPQGQPNTMTGPPPVFNTDPSQPQP